MEAASQLVGKFVTYVLNPIMLLLFAAGFALFMFGLLEFMLNLSKGEASDSGKQHMLWGIIGMVIMVSVLGIVTIIDNTFGFGALSGTGSATDANRIFMVTQPANF